MLQLLHDLKFAILISLVLVDLLDGYHFASLCPSRLKTKMVSLLKFMCKSGNRPDSKDLPGTRHQMNHFQLLCQRCRCSSSERKKINSKYNAQRYSQRHSFYFQNQAQYYLKQSSSKLAEYRIRSSNLIARHSWASVVDLHGDYSF